MDLRPAAFWPLALAALCACKAGPGACPSSLERDAGAKDAGASKDAGTSKDAGAGGIDFCKACGEPGSCGTVQNDAVRETSGIAASAVHDGVYYLHNDSADLPRFFAIDEAGRDLGAYTLDGAHALDWEDIAIGPCPSGSCVYLADTGDNHEERHDYTIYRVNEPFALSAGDHTVAAETFTFVYPDGSHDCEALLVHPVTGAITLVTKDRSGAGLARIYTLPDLVAGQTLTAIAKGQIEPTPHPTRVTAGSVHPKAKGALLRTDDGLLFYAMKSKESVASALLRAPCAVPVADEKQGEAVAWLRSGDGWVTAGEGRSPAISFVLCGDR